MTASQLPHTLPVANPRTGGVAALEGRPGAAQAAWARRPCHGRFDALVASVVALTAHGAVITAVARLGICRQALLRQTGAPLPLAACAERA
jgi:hypothetical protein